MVVNIVGRLARAFAKGPRQEGAFNDMEAKHEEGKARKEAEKKKADERRGRKQKGGRLEKEQ